MTPSLHVNHEYLLHWARSASPEGPVLDFGCGAGAVVLAGRERGLELYGADAFEGREDQRDKATRAGLIGDTIRMISDDGRLPFDDELFTMVVANQVFEHIADFERPLREISRVLKPGGRLLALFPSLGVIREGHIGIPMAHWFPPGGIQYRYVHLLRSLGLGHSHWGGGASWSSAEWARRTTAYLRDHTFYRRKHAAIHAFQRHFDVALIEEDYLEFRLHRAGLATGTAALIRLPPARHLAKTAMRLLAGMVVLGTKRT